MPRWNENLYPPIGFEFIDADNVRHTGGSLSDLISKLAAYRTRRGLPPGNPSTECNDYLCSRFPSRCLNGTPPPVSTAKPGVVTSATRLTEWLRSMWLKVSQKRMEFVGEETIKSRTATCLTCPYHTAFPSECAACVETIDRISFQLRAGRDKHSSLLRMCGKFATDLRVDVLTVQPCDPNAPENCWKHDPSKNL